MGHGLPMGPVESFALVGERDESAAMDEARSLKRTTRNHEGAAVPRPDLDPVDLRLLRLLTEDARLSSRRLGREIGMSPGAVSERVARLERDGVIRAYRADVDPRALGFGMQVIIGLRTEQSPLLEQTFDEVAAIPEVELAHVVAGSWDLVLYLHVRDHEHLRTVILERLWHLSAFRHSETMLVLDSRHGPIDWFAPPGEPER